MSSVSTTGALLARDKVDRFRPFGAFGKPAYQSHVQLRAMLVSRLGKQCADYFARPVYDPDTGELRWISECFGVETDIESMDDAVRARLGANTERIHSALRDAIDRLRSDGGNQAGGAGAYASLLEQALKVPREGKHLHYVGEQPVLSFWGFETQQGQSVDPGSIPSLLPAAMLPPAPEPLALEENKKHPWWWWLLWLLLALLLLMLGAVALRACVTVEPAAPLPPITRGMQPGQDLVIPPNALKNGDLNFLDGLWQLGQNRLNTFEGRPDNVTGSYRSTMRFNKNGSGNIYGTERISQGKGVEDCAGGLSARTDGTTLYIDASRCQAPSNPPDGLKMECKLDGAGKTVCEVVNPGGHRFTAPLRRLN